MELVLLYSVLIVILLAVLFREGRKKDGIVQRYSRVIFMRELRNKMTDPKAGNSETKPPA